MNATPQAKAFCRAIRNPLKRTYAQSYLLWLCKEGRDYFTGLPVDEPRPPSDLGYMAAQAVRMTYDKLMPGAIERAESAGAPCN